MADFKPGDRVMYQGRAGTVIRVTEMKVQLEMDDGEHPKGLPDKTSLTKVDTKRQAWDSNNDGDGAPGTPRPASAGAAPRSPSTLQTKKHVSKIQNQPLLLDSSSSLDELKRFIDREKLPIAKHVGGIGRRTKADILADIRVLWDQKHAIDVQYMDLDLDPESPSTRAGMKVYLPREMSLSAYLQLVNGQLGGMEKLLQATKERAIKENRLLGTVKDFSIDAPTASGLARSLGMTTREHAIEMAKGPAAIVSEFEVSGTATDKQCLDYVMNKKAGSDTTEFWNGMMDHERPADYGKTLDDFVNHEYSRMAGLDTEEVIALRVYTTAAYKSLNDPFMKKVQRHPFPATIGFLVSGIKKLRANDKSCATTDLFRGLSDVGIDKESPFLEVGGTNGAPMSTSKDLSTALRYAASKTMLVLKIRTDNFRQRGADISFLSAFPGEKEYLYPPGTYLQPVEDGMQKFKIGGPSGADVQFIEVTADIE